MKEFFQVVSIQTVLDMAGNFPLTGTEELEVFKACGRILARDIVSRDNVPEFARSTMDGYAVSASSTFGASESIPAMLEVAGRVEMGTAPEFSVGPGQAALMPTGGMLPQGTDAVVMVEHTEILDDKTIEVYKSVAPLGHVLDVGDDVRKGEILLKKGTRLRPQDLAAAASVGESVLPVYKKPVVGIVSTGDEVVAADRQPGPGQIRDMNTYALGGLCHQAGAESRSYGIVGDDPVALRQACEKALAECDMLLVSGGSSVGARDHTIEVIEGFDKAGVLVHGVSISPGKPTILAKVGDKQVWGLPGHVTFRPWWFFTPWFAGLSFISPDARARTGLCPCRPSSPATFPRCKAEPTMCGFVWLKRTASWPPSPFLENPGSSAPWWRPTDSSRWV